MTESDAPEPGVEETLAALKGLWTVALATPAIYMLIGLAVGKMVFAHRPANGFAPLPENEYRWLLAVAAASAIALTATLAWVRTLRGKIGAAMMAKTSPRPGAVPAALAPDSRATTPLASILKRYRWQTYTMLTISDFIAFEGLALYLVQGDALSQGVMSALAWINYGLSKPLQR